MTPERYAKILSVLNQRQPDLTVITDHVHKGQNLSAIIRTCDAVGIPRVHAVYETGHFRAHTGTAMGSHKWVQTCMYRAIEEPIDVAQQAGMQVLAAHLTPDAMDYRDVDFTRPTALLLGAEKWGVSESAVCKVDGCVVVPMMGMAESYNVSVACAIILAEAQRQREAAGLYQQQRLPQKEYDRLLFEWCQPVITRYCRQWNLPYPELDETGHLKEPQQFSEQVNALKQQRIMDKANKNKASVK